MRYLGLTFACLCLASAASAQVYSVEPGLWEYEGTGVFAGAAEPVSGTECVTEKDNEFDVDELLFGLAGPSCDFDHANGRDFSLSCTGEFTASASGTLRVERRRVELDTNGTVTVDGGANLPLSIQFTAKRVSACPAP